MDDTAATTELAGQPALHGRKKLGIHSLFPKCPADRTVNSCFHSHVLSFLHSSPTYPSAARRVRNYCGVLPSGHAEAEVRAISQFQLLSHGLINTLAFASASLHSSGLLFKSSASACARIVKISERERRFARSTDSRVG
jgi:hypothetical protein